MSAKDVGMDHHAHAHGAPGGPPPPGTSRMRPAIVLLIVALGAAAVLGATYVRTKPGIDANVEKKLRAAQVKVLPGADEFKKRSFGDITYYDAFSNGKKVGRVIQVDPVGYAGPIDMIVGIADGKVTGWEVLQMKETPGFGDKVASSAKFKSQFTGKRASDPVALRRDIDAVTGATISSRGFTRGVRDALDVDRRLEGGGS